MHEDKNGKPLKVGDVVLVRFVVQHVQMEPDYSSISLATLEPATHNGLPSSVILTGAQIEFVSSK